MAWHFQGFTKPNSTQVPDQLFDDLLHVLSGNELKVVMYVVRRTFGFKKDSDNISLSQMLNGIVKSDGVRLDHGVGLSKPTLLKVLRTLIEKRVLVANRRSSREKGDMATNYRLHFAEVQVVPDPHEPSSGGRPGGGKKQSLPVVKNFDQGGVKGFDQALVKPFDHTTNSRQQTVDNTHGVRAKRSEEIVSPNPAGALVAYFHERLGSAPGRQPTARELSQAARLLDGLDPERCRFAVDYAIERAAETKFQMRHFGAIESYVHDALGAFEAAQTARRRRNTELQKQREEDERREAERAEWRRLSPEERVERRIQTNLLTFRIVKGRDATEADIEELRRKFSEQEGLAAPAPTRRTG